jgi:ribonuclease HIII
MDADLDFCLKRFVDEQVTDSIKQVAQLERNLKIKRTNIEDTKQLDDEAICQQENILVKQFSHDLN